MKAKFYMGPKDGAEEDVQTSNGFAPDIYQIPADFRANIPVSDLNIRLVKHYYDLQEVKDNVAYYKYRCTA
jgi:hypothetical protein